MHTVKIAPCYREDSFSEQKPDVECLKVKINDVSSITDYQPSNTTPLNIGMARKSRFPSILKNQNISLDNIERDFEPNKIVVREFKANGRYFLLAKRSTSLLRQSKEFSEKYETIDEDIKDNNDYDSILSKQKTDFSESISPRKSRKNEGIQFENSNQSYLKNIVEQPLDISLRGDNNLKKSQKNKIIMHRIRRKIKEERITEIIRNAKSQLEDNSFENIKEQKRRDTQEESLYKYISKMGKNIQYDMLKKTRDKIIKNDSPQKSPLIIKEEIRNSREKSSVNFIAQSNKKQQYFNTEQSPRTKKYYNPPINITELKPFGSPQYENKSKSLGSPKKECQQNKNENVKFSIMTKRNIKITGNDEKFIMHFKNIANHPNEPFFFILSIKRTQLQEYLETRYPKPVVKIILNFTECPSSMNFREYKKWVQGIGDWTLNQILFMCFLALDFNQDGFICQSDAFSILSNSQTTMLENDFQKISCYAGIKNPFNIYLVINLLLLALKMKFTDDVKKLIDNPIYPEVYSLSQISRTLFMKVEAQQEFGDREKFLLQIQKQKELGANLTLFSVWEIVKEKIQIEEASKDKEELIPEQVKSQHQFQKKDASCYFKKDKKFKFNFYSFKGIFLKEKPFFFFDLLAALALIEWTDINYPYKVEEEFSKQTQILLEQRRFKSRKIDKNLLKLQTNIEENKEQVQNLFITFKNNNNKSIPRKVLRVLNIPSSAVQM